MSTYQPGCISCDTLLGKFSSPGGTIYENAFWHVNHIGAPIVWKGFLIIKAKRHVEHLAELTPEEAGALGPVIQAACRALTQVLRPAKVFVCSFGDGTRHVHFWALPRPPEMKPGMHPVLFNLDLRMTLTKKLGFKRWLVPNSEVEALANDLRRIWTPTI